MNLMQLIKLVLDDAYGSIKTGDEKAKDEAIKKDLETLSMEYAALANAASHPIDYSDPLKRFAYIYKYTVAHADYIMQLIRDTDILRERIAGQNVEIACLGGGPGSDFLGVLKYLIQRGVKDTSVTSYIFDKERAWGDSWSDVARVLKAPFQTYPVFQQMDVTDRATWIGYEKYLRADVFTLSYFMSEVWKIKEAAEPYFAHCMSRMKPGAVMLFIDNNDSRFKGWFDELAKANNLEILVAKSGQLSFSNDEEKRDLGQYFEKFGWPKRASDAAWRVAIKRQA